MSEKLKPCPFCGGEAYYLTPKKMQGSAFVAVGVECKQCGAVPFMTMVYEAETSEKKRRVAAKHWNRRVKE